MNKRFILVDPSCGLVFGDLAAESPTAAARAVDEDLGIGPCSYVEEHTSDDLRDAYLVYDASDCDVSWMPIDRPLSGSRQPAALNFVCVVQRVD